eukprot:666801_1
MNAVNKDIAHGFMRMIRRCFPDDSSYYNIQREIMDIIWKYVHIKIEFNKQFHAQNLTFIDDTTVQINSEDDAIALIGEEISSEYCQTFTVQIKWVKKAFAFDFGYVHEGAPQSITDWNQLLGHDLMAQCSQSFFIGWNHRCFYHWGKGTSSAYSSTKYFAEGDTFSLEFDFVNNTVTIYHNGEKAETKSLQGCKKLTPAISLRSGGGNYNNLQPSNSERVQIVKYSFWW